MARLSIGISEKKTRKSRMKLTSVQCGTGGRHGHGRRAHHGAGAEPRQSASRGCGFGRRCDRGKLCTVSSIPWVRPTKIHTGLVAGHTGTTASVGLRQPGLVGGLGRAITLAMASNRAVDSPGGGLGRSAGVEFRVIACRKECISFELWGFPEKKGAGGIYQEARRGSVKSQTAQLANETHKINSPNSSPSSSSHKHVARHSFRW